MSRGLERIGGQGLIDDISYAFAKPWLAVKGFALSWFSSRPWGKLVWAAPVLIGALVLFSVVFIQMNRSRGKAYSGYYQGALKALSQRDFKKADFLFAKLIHHPSYKDSDSVLFRAMIAAASNRNLPREQALKQKLFYEREYEPAKRWVVERALSGKSGTANLDELVEIAREMLGEAEDASYYDYWNFALARLLYEQKHFQVVLEVLELRDELDPEAHLLQVRSLIMLNEVKNARQELKKLVKYIEFEDPDLEVYLGVYMNALTILAQSSKDVDEQQELYNKAIGELEKQQLFARNTEYIDRLKSSAHVKIARVLFETHGTLQRELGFIHLNAAIDTGVSTSEAATLLFGLLDSDSKFSVLTGQIVEALGRHGGAGCHLAMAIDRWYQGDYDAMKVHLLVARSLEPKAFDIMGEAAVVVARKYAKGDLDFSLFNNSATYFKRSFRMVDVLESVDPDHDLKYILVRCEIHSKRQQWSEVVNLLETVVSTQDPTTLNKNEYLKCLQWLITSYAELGDRKRSVHYQQLYIDAMKKPAA
ncbi:hypothetical protein [Rubritalea marina]|uniref:hypothetical protein n=1 Tax=Rubritalea marina TaxID=361055 RepID=UPI00196A0DDC|nr:hypothetical protein [Rubritalea marina]